MRVQRCVRARRLAAFAVVAAALCLVAGCSSSSTPSLFPAVLDRPAPREDTPLSPDQVKQATDNLIAERNRLCAEAVANGNPAAANCAAAPAQTAGGAAKP
jgi:ABC-type oligopeptide transport system substrate-binding subunit